MQSKLILAFAAAASAQNFMANPLVRRNIDASNLQPRQTLDADALDGLSDDCQSAVMDIAQSIPTPPPAVLSDALENPQTDACSLSVPSSLSSAYSSYEQQLSSWIGDNIEELVSVVGECPELASLTSLVPVCSTDAGALLGGDTSATATADDTASASAAETTAATPKSSGASATEANKTAEESASGTADSASSTPTETSSAGRNTGMIGAVLAAAGIAVAAL